MTPFMPQSPATGPDPGGSPPAPPAGGTLILPAPLAQALWAHAEREAPRECVGALGGVIHSGPDGTPVWQADALYPLGNVAAHPDRTYLADPGHLVRALKAMAVQGQVLVGLYHSHPTGPDRPSDTDVQLASYLVPYLIAALPGRTLCAHLLPGGQEVPIAADPAPS